MDDCCCEKPRHRKAALALAVITVCYNVVEGVVSIWAGAAAGSVALVGFGLDSFIESLSGAVMIWRFSSPCSSAEEEANRERRAVTLVGITFFILAAYVLFESVKKLVSREPPDKSLAGIIIALVSLVTMPTLFVVKRRVAKRIASPSLAADSKQTLACTFLSFALLLGLGANYLFGFWQADPLVGLLVVAYLTKEGIEALRTRRLCTC